MNLINILYNFINKNIYKNESYFYKKNLRYIFDLNI